MRAFYKITLHVVINVVVVLEISKQNRMCHLLQQSTKKYSAHTNIRSMTQPITVKFVVHQNEHRRVSECVLGHFLPSLLITGHKIYFMYYFFQTIANGIFKGYIMFIIEHCRYIWVICIETMTVELRFEPCKSNVYL